MISVLNCSISHHYQFLIHYNLVGFLMHLFDITPVFNHIKNNQTKQKHNSPRCMAQPKQGS